MQQPAISVGVLGGSGVYDLDGLAGAQEVRVETPFGAPSDAVVVGEWEGVRAGFLPRHGRGHRHAPDEVPYRANLWALRALGAHRVLSVSAVGSLCEEYAPGDFVLVDQFVDRTFRRASSFFGAGAVVHVPLAEPACAQTAQAVRDAAAGLPMKVHLGGAYLGMEGPQFSTRAESQLHRSWGCKVVGMTNATEAKLAREAGMSFCCVAMVTDYDAWQPAHGEVDVARILEVAARNARNARELVRRALKPVAALGPSPWRGIARASLLTAPDAIPAAARARLALLLDLPE